MKCHTYIKNLNLPIFPGNPGSPLSPGEPSPGKPGSPFDPGNPSKHLVPGKYGKKNVFNFELAR